MTPLLFVTGLLLLAATAPALAQERCSQSPPPNETAPGGPMQYCFDTIAGRPILWLYGGIGGGSAKNVTPGLQQTRRYHEVWLNSGGGSVNEGVWIGLALRQVKATVRVPKHPNVMCASSCTNLALGGYIRIIDEGARFFVHAASSVSSMNISTSFGKLRSGEILTAGRLIELSRADPTILEAVVEHERSTQPPFAVRFVMYLQSMIEGTPNERLYRQIESARLPPYYGPPGTSKPNMQLDLARLKLEGLVALQEILTQVELDSMGAMLNLMRTRQHELGRGAEEALDIFQATLNCRIQDLCHLQRHELIKLGYKNFVKE